MGLFGKLFEKKICSICDNEIGLFGNNKLADGNMCDNCYKNLSPFFDNARKSTISQIQKQLAYREENKEAVKAFKVTRTLGKNGGKVLLDEDDGKFVALKSSTTNWRADNPDVLKFSQITGCSMDVDEDEDKKEIKRKNSKGEDISFNPPRYEYSYKYDVYVNIDVQHEYFDKMRIKINNSSIETKNRGISAELDNCKNIAKQIQTSLTDARQDMRKKSAAAKAPKKAVTCPWCGATTVPDAGGCCEYCGGAVSK